MSVGSLVNKFLKPDSHRNFLIITFVQIPFPSGQVEQGNPLNETIQPNQGKVS